MKNATNVDIERPLIDSSLRRYAYFLAFVVCLIVPSAAIFKKAGIPALIVYVILALLTCWWMTRRFWPWLRALRVPLFLETAAAVILCIGLSSLYSYAHPRIDTAGFRIGGVSIGASDNDDAIDVALDELFAGRYPYYARTFLDNPLSPLPGALLLAMPFYLLGDSALLNVFWTVMFFWFVQRRMRSMRAAVMLAAIVLFLSPNATYQIVQGTDYGANTIYVFIFAALLLERVRRDGCASIASAAAAVLLGIGLSSRLNFVMVLPFVFIALLRSTSWKNAMLSCAIAAIVFIVVTAPFYVYDPAGFSPLHTFGKLSAYGRIPWAAFVAPLVACVASVVLMWRRRGRYEPTALARDLSVVMAFLVFVSVVIYGIAGGIFVFWDALHFGTFFLYPGVFGFGIPLLEDNAAS